MWEMDRWLSSPLPSGSGTLISFNGTPWLSGGPSSISGNGLFSDRVFNIGEQIACYLGEKCSPGRGKNSKYVFKLASGYVDGENHFSGLMNSRVGGGNNAEVRESGGIFAVDFIARGTEITVPYGSSYVAHHMPRATRVASNPDPVLPVQLLNDPIDQLEQLLNERAENAKKLEAMHMRVERETAAVMDTGIRLNPALVAMYGICPLIISLSLSLYQLSLGYLSRPRFSLSLSLSFPLSLFSPSLSLTLPPSLYIC